MLVGVVRVLAPPVHRAECGSVFQNMPQALMPAYRVPENFDFWVWPFSLGTESFNRDFPVIMSSERLSESHIFDISGGEHVTLGALPEFA